jgi:hypothetical protein
MKLNETIKMLQNNRVINSEEMDVATGRYYLPFNVRDTFRHLRKRFKLSYGKDYRSRFTS